MPEKWGDPVTRHIQDNCGTKAADELNCHIHSSVGEWFKEEDGKMSTYVWIQVCEGELSTRRKIKVTAPR